MRRALLALTLFAATAHADPAEDQHVQNANDYYKVGNFEGALAEYRAAFAIDPKPEYLYAMATIEDQRGGCEAAIGLYQQFIDTKPPAEDVTAAEGAIDACKKRLGIEPQPPVEKPKPEPKPLPPPPPAPMMRREHRSGFGDPLGITLVATGVVGLAGGGAFYLLARSDNSKANDPQSKADYDALVSRAHDFRLYGEIAAGAGAAFAIAGVVRWMTADRWREVPVAPMATGDAVGVTFASRW